MRAKTQTHFSQFPFLSHPLNNNVYLFFLCQYTFPGTLNLLGCALQLDISRFIKAVHLLFTVSLLLILFPSFFSTTQPPKYQRPFGCASPEKVKLDEEKRIIETQIFEKMSNSKKSPTAEEVGGSERGQQEITKACKCSS